MKGSYQFCKICGLERETEEDHACIIKVTETEVPFKGIYYRCHLNRMENYINELEKRISILEEKYK